MSKLNTFEDGAIMLASELIANGSDPARVSEALNTMGVREYDCTELSDFDKYQLKKIPDDELKLSGTDYEDPDYMKENTK